MVTRKNTMPHRPKLTSPFYADPGDGTMLHRYLDESFVPRFQEELANGKLKGTKDQAWRESDRFGKYAQNSVCLRLPLHRTFYMVSCEISCDVLGNPAFDPRKIKSAGFVVRRGAKDNFHTWQVRQGQALGWRKESYPELEPDHYRRLKNRKLIASRARDPLFSGEQTHPLNAELVERSDGPGHSRKHCILSGFLPLGGSVEATQQRDEEQSVEPRAANARVSTQGQLAEFEWPFGSWDGDSNEVRCDCSGSLSEVASGMCGHIEWANFDGLQVKEGGIASRAFVAVLKVLLERYRINDGSLFENEAIRTALASVYFYQQIESDKAKDHISLDPQQRDESLLAYIDVHTEELLGWLSELDQEQVEIDQVSTALPQSKQFLYFTKSQAESLRELLVLRAEHAEKLVENSLALPRYGQAKDDEYFILPFARYIDDCGCEQIIWGPASKPFRVVSPLDPEAVRPSLIQLPELSDIKRGFAKGVTFLTPKSIADIMEQVSPDLEFKKKAKKNRFQACLGFSISFSIPIITICALILLMIILNLLNLFFFWLPYAILKLPRKC